MAGKGNAVGSFALECAGADNMFRIFAEHPDQMFSITTTPMQLAKKMPDRPLKPDCQFSWQSILELAAQGFTNDPRFGDDKDARKKICGTLLYLANAMGATDIALEK